MDDYYDAQRYYLLKEINERTLSLNDEYLTRNNDRLAKIADNIEEQTTVLKQILQILDYSSKL